MNTSTHPVVRWLGAAIVLIAVAAVGWYLGSRTGGDASPAAASHDAASHHGGAHGDAGFQVYRNVGARVVRIDPQHSTITLDHEAIEGFMSAMVMDLKVADTVNLQGLEPDQEIVFDLGRIDGTYKVLDIRPAGPPQTPPQADTDEPPLGRGDRVPDLTLLDIESNAFELRDMQPRHKLITFFYARCPLKNFCPAQSARLSELQKHLEETGSDLHLVSLTLNAENDTPQVLAAYAEHFGADPGRWTLAGSKDAAAIRTFARRAGAQVQVHADESQIDHALIGLRVDGDRIVDFVYGLQAIEALVRNL